MPELPEVETVRRGLERRLVGKVIVGGVVPSPKILRAPVTGPSEFLTALRGQRIQNVRRRGKHLIFTLGNGYALVSHLKMRGHMRVVGEGRSTPVDGAEQMPEKFLRLALDLDDGSQFRFYDIWGWGEMRLVPDREEEIARWVPALSTMGPEPLSDEFTADRLREAAGRHAKTSIKACLLNQDVVAGIGNIYADESLHRAGIDPSRRAGSLNPDEWRRLRQEIRAVLTEAVEGSGTVSDNFFDTKGEPGRYVPRVYDRAGKPCLVCGTTLVGSKITGRSTVSCPKCQA